MMRLGWIALTVAITAHATGQLPSSYACLPGTPHSGTIAGTVTRAESDRPAANVMVELHDSTRACRTRSDLHGRYLFHPGRSTWRLTISNPGDQQFVHDGLRIRGGDNLTVNPRLRPLVLTLDECALIARCSELLSPHRDAGLDRNEELLVAAARTGLALADIRHHPDWRACVTWEGADRRQTGHLDAALVAAVPQASPEPECRAATKGQSPGVVARLAVTSVDRGGTDPTITLRLRAGPSWAERWTCHFRAADAGWQADSCQRDSDPSAGE